MKQIKLMSLAIAATLIVGALGASTASANVLNPPEFIFCAMVAKAGTGTFEKNNCEAPVGTKLEYIEAKFPATKLANGNECAEVYVAKTGNFQDNKCSTAMAKGEFVEVKPLGFKFTDKEGTTNLYSADGIITCTADTSTGEITGPKSVGNVKVTFTGCTTENSATKVKCEVNGGTIKTETLSGELGYISKTAKTVGEDLKPTTGSTFVELKTPCLEVTTTKVTGSVIGQVTPVNSLVKAGKLTYGVESTKKTTQAIQNLEGASKDTLLTFGAAAGFESIDEVTFEEYLMITA